MTLLERLQRIPSLDVSNAPDILTSRSRDTSLFEVRPEAVVFPSSQEDVEQVVRATRDMRKEGMSVSLTARSGGTDMTGGPLTTSVVVDFSKHMNRLLDVSDQHAVVEPGMYYRDFEKATLTHGAILPSFPASRDICMLGGMLANNSGGEKTLRYGKTERYVESLDVVLDSGETCTFQALTKSALEEKKKLKTREGEIYRDLSKLIFDNTKIIQAAKPDVSKNASGYALWNVWDPVKETFDVSKLLCGSQGTLGLITRARVKLVRPLPHSRLLVIFLRDMKPLAELVNTVLAHDPESFESYDDHTFALAVRLFPAIAKRLKGSTLGLAWRFLPEFWMTLTGGLPKLVLLAEFTAATPEEAEAAAQAARKDLARFRVHARITRSRVETEKYWVMRRESFNLLRKHVHKLHTAPFIDDIIVRPEHLPEFLPKLNAILERYPITFTVAGHVGDGNFHIIPLMDLSKPDAKSIIERLAKDVYELVFSYKGSMSAEHNDGLIRSPLLPEMFGPEVYALFEQTKMIFDPDNIFNPGKKVGASATYAMDHIAAYK